MPTWVLLGLLLGQMPPADPAETLQRLQLEHQVEIFAAREKLSIEFDDAVQAVVRKNDQTAALTLLEGKRKFLQENLLPGDAALSNAVVDYASARRAADAKLSAEGKKLFDATVDVKLASDLRQRLDVYLKDGAAHMATAQSRVQQANAVQARATRICDSLSKIIATHDDLVERLSKVKSSLNKPSVGDAFVDEANKLLRGQSWTLTCRIISIHSVPSQKGRYELQIEPPLETASVAGEWRTDASWKVALQREQAEKIEAGDWLEITATPVFARDSAGMFNRFFRTKQGALISGSIVMHNARTNVRRQNAAAPKAPTP